MDSADSSKQEGAATAEANYFRLILLRHPIAPDDLALLKRLTIVIVVGALLLSAFHHLNLVYSHKFFDVTGRAEWIWAPTDVSPGVATVMRARGSVEPRRGPLASIRNRIASLGNDLKEVAALAPVHDGRFDSALARQTLRDLFTRDDRPMAAREDPLAFFATHNFDLPASRYYTHIKVVADPEYTLYFNGHEIGGRRVGEESRLDVYDVSALARTGRNRIVVAVRSTNSVGGLIAAVDLSPEVANYVVTDASWRIATALTPDLLQRDPVRVEKAVVIGEPPIGRWNYLELQELPLETTPTQIAAPKSSFSFLTALPEIRDASGTTIVSQRRERATAFDFGEIDGRLRLTRLYNVHLPAVVNVRFANAPQELRPIEGPVRPFVFAPGEATVSDPEVRHFRFASVYGRPARVEVLK
jgi:hypothetical protein